MFNIGTGNATSVIDLLDVITATAGTPMKSAFAPARAGEWRRGALDSTKAMTELGWTAGTSIAAGILRTYHELTQGQGRRQTSM